jgi:hypothetical protein
MPSPADEPQFDTRRPTHVLVDRDCETCRAIVAELERHGAAHRPERTTQPDHGFRWENPESEFVRANVEPGHPSLGDEPQVVPDDD